MDAPGATPPDLATILPSIGIVVVLFVSGVVYFKRMERTFADVI